MGPNDLTDKPSDKDIEYIVDSMIEEEDSGIEESDAEDLKYKMKQDRADFDEALHLYGMELESTFSDYAGKRSLKEAEWIDAILQCRKQRNDFFTKEQYEKGAAKTVRTPKINITTNKVNMAVSRMIDIALPLGGDYNFKIDPCPDPEIEAVVGDDTPMQQDPTVSRGNVAGSILSEQIDRANRMQQLIEKQLSEGDFGRLTREGMYDWAQLGTAIFQGPTIKTIHNKHYEHHKDSSGGTQSEVIREKEYVAVPERVDIRYFYPNPEILIPEDLDKAFVIRPSTESEIKRLSKNDSFMKERLKVVLEKGPDAVQQAKIFNLNGIIDTDYSLKNKYILKTYHGPIGKNVLKYFPELAQDLVFDDFAEIIGEVWFVNGEIIRVSVSPLDGDENLPFQIVVWERDHGSLFGHGMPYKMRDQQVVADAAWKMLIDNSGLSAGPQLVLNKEMIEPANQKWDIEPFKIWYFTEYGSNVNDAIQFVNIPNNQEALARVVDMALQFADVESETPMISQNMMTQANNASSLGMVFTEGNVTQRELSMAWDKYIIVPLIQRFVDYNMQYSDDPAIKGNYYVKVGAATQRIDNQIISQDIERILAMAGQDPSYHANIDPIAAFRKWVSATRVGPEILRPIKEVEAELQQMQEAAAEQPPDAATITAQATMMREESRQAEREQEIQMKQAEYQMDQEDREFERSKIVAEYQDRQEQRALERWIKEQEFQAQLVKIAAEQETTITDLRAKLDITEMNNEAKLEAKAIDLAQFREQIEMKQRYGTGVSQV